MRRIRNWPAAAEWMERFIAPAGREIMRELDEIRARIGRCEPGSAVVTCAGRAACEICFSCGWTALSRWQARRSGAAEILLRHVPEPGGRTRREHHQLSLHQHRYLRLPDRRSGGNCGEGRSRSGCSEHADPVRVVKLVQFSDSDHQVYRQAAQRCAAVLSAGAETVASPAWLECKWPMQVLEAGSNKYLLLELDPESIGNIARQAGFEFQDRRPAARVVARLVGDRPAGAACCCSMPRIPGNLGWFSRCQFYVDGKSGSVLQTPLSLANQRDRTGRTLPHAVRLQIAKELPGHVSHAGPPSP